MRRLWSFVDLGLILNILLALFWLDDTHGQKTDRTSALSHKIYEPIHGVLPCFRRMNGTHQIGCSTSANGDVGVLHRIDNENEQEGLDWILNKGPHAPYIVLMYLSSFRSDLLKKLNNPDRVSGILLIENANRVSNFSTDATCPNVGYGLYNKTSSPHYCEKWNEPGSSLLFQEWAFSVIYIQGKDQAKTLLDCYKTFNEPINGTARDWPLCAGQLKAHMIAAVDSPTCVRRNDMSMSVWNMSPRSVCDPVGGVNIFSPLVNRSQAEPYPSESSVIVIATRMDSSSMFDKFTPGADSSATGLTALLALVKQLQPLRASLPNSKIQNVYFIIFNGEAFDYIGSSRVVYDMLQDKFPMEDKDNSSNHPALLRLKDIKYFIELEQLALYSKYSSNSPSYFIHRNWDSPSTGTGGAVSELVNTLEEKAKLLNLNVLSIQNGTDWKGLPPASLQSFLTNSPDFPGIVITNHDEKSFRNKHYNSILDDDINIEYDGSVDGHTVQAISKLVATVGRTVEELIRSNIENEESLIEQDPILINDILQCYVKTAKCPLFQSLKKDNPQLSDKPFSLYSGVYGKYARFTLASDAVIKVMTYYQGEVVDKDEKDCKHDNEIPLFDYLWLNGSCYKTTVGVTAAKSPAFDIEDYDWASGNYSTWTESSWNQFSVKIFLKPSLAHDLLTLLFGLAIFIISTIIIYWVNEKSDLIFPSRREQIC